MNWKFGVTPGKVVYLGHLTFTYKAETKKVEASERRTSSFKVDSSLRWENEAALQHIEELNPDSRWLKYELVQATKRE